MKKTAHLSAIGNKQLADVLFALINKHGLSAVLSALDSVLTECDYGESWDNVCDHVSQSLLELEEHLLNEEVN